MSDTKMMYVYNTYDSIIDLVEGISTHHFEENNFPRGRGQTPFSVDRRALISSDKLKKE